ncbi:MAG: alpha/beta fold hydrolase [Acidimicrobiales bacterium]|nr:alpha/beta fold hydrolase [Acidimicrobiales bacterium]
MPVADLPSGMQIFHESFGDSTDPTVLLMHGLGSQLLVWEEGLCRLLADEGFHIIRYDHRDSGLSTIFGLAGPPGGRPYDLFDMATDAVDLLDHLEIADAHVVGFSLGGMVAQTFAVAHPNRCRSLVSMGSSTGNPEFGRPDGAVVAAMLAASPTDPVEAVEKELADRRLWASIWHDDEHARTVFAGYRKRSIQPRHAFERQWAAATSLGNREALLATIEVPTRVVHGSVDTLITASAGERTAVVVPGAEFVLLEGWGHDMAPGAWPVLVPAIVGHCHAVDLNGGPVVATT